MKVTASDVTTRLLRPSDIPTITALTGAVGWNQLPEDWERLLSLEPEGCFAVECSGQLAATTTVVCYGTDLAWIGMVLTFPAFRRCGFAELLMRHALAFAERREVKAIGLDATEMGGNLYRKLGFMDGCAIERWQRLPAPAVAAPAQPYCPDPAYDREAFGANRGSLLDLLAPLGAAGISGQGYAMGRLGSQAAYFGPCVARTSAAARSLLRWYLAQHPGEVIFWDLFPDNRDAVRLAEEFQFAPARRLMRMFLSDKRAPNASHRAEVFAIAGFEFG